MQKANEKDWYKKWEALYNEGAKVFNSLPGEKLVWPRDRFNIKYCYHKSFEREPVQKWEQFDDGNGGTFSARVTVKPPCCKHCGLPYPGSYDS